MNKLLSFSFSVFLHLVCFQDLVSAACIEEMGWVPYRDQKCIKILEEDPFLQFDNAAGRCFSEPTGVPNSFGVILTIKTSKEQEFIQNYIFGEQKIQDNVWLNLRRKNATEPFLWQDDDTTTNETYSNWGPDNPVDEDDRDCVEMRSDFADLGDVDKEFANGPLAAGHWFNGPCTRRALVVCESLPNVTLFELKTSLNQVMRRLERLESLLLPPDMEEFYDQEII